MKLHCKFCGAVNVFFSVDCGATWKCAYCSVATTKECNCEEEQPKSKRVIGVEFKADEDFDKLLNPEGE